MSLIGLLKGNNMKKLLRYLSPFAPDQSGACGVLYELGGLVVICDAGGCAGNICGFDEPRWFTKKSAVFSAGLRDMDAIMGRDDKLIDKLAYANEAIPADFSAIVGTPVPAVIGTDMKALKKMAEKRLGIPCITAACTGTRYFDKGEEEVWDSLFREFAVKSDDEDNSSAPAIGIIGATPLSTGFMSGSELRKLLDKKGYENCVVYSMGDSKNNDNSAANTLLEQIKNAGSCTKNIVISPAALKAAEYLKETFGTPYEVDYPFIPAEFEEAILSDIRDAASGKDRLSILIIHSQFAANKLREIINSNISSEISSCTTEICCATFFMQSSDYTSEGDLHLSDEDELWEIAKSNKYDIIIADGETETLLQAAGFSGISIEYPEFAISGKLFEETI